MAIGDILVRVGADIGSYVRNMNKASQVAGTFGATVSGIGVGVSAAFTGMALASTVGLVTMVSTASTYESAFVGVRKVLDGTEQDFDKLSKGIRNMAKEIPMTTEQIAEIAQTAGQLGIKTEDILHFTRTVADLGVTTNMSASEAATAMARFANITGMSMDDVDRLGATVVHLGNNLASTESEIMNMGMRLAGAGAQIGLTESEILSFAGALSSVGIKVEAGGTAFSRVFLEMQTAVMDAGEDLDKFAKVAGMSADDFATSFETKPADAILAFIKGLDNIGESGGNTAQVLKDLGLGEIRVRDALLRAAGASDLFAESVKLGNTAWKENTALIDEAQQRYAVLESKLRILMNRLKEVVLIFGLPMLDVLKNAIDALDPFLNKIEDVANKFDGLSDKAKNAVATFMLLIPVFSLVGVAIGGVITLIGGIISAFAGIGFILSTTAVAFSTIGIVAVAVGIIIVKWVAILGTVTAAMALLWKESEVFRDKMVDAFKRVYEVAVEIFEGLISFFKKFGNKLSDFWAEEGGHIVRVLETLFLNVYDIVSSVFDRLYPVFKRVWTNIGDIILNFIDVVEGVFSLFNAIIDGDFRKANESAQKIVKASWDIVVKLFTIAFDVIINQAVQFALGLGDVLLSRWKAVISGIGAHLEELRKMFVKKVDEWKAVFVDFLKGLPKMFLDRLDLIADVVSTWFGKNLAIIERKLDEWGTAIGSWFGSVPGIIAGKMSGWVSAFDDWFTYTRVSIENNLTVWKETIIEWFSNMPSNIKELLIKWADVIQEWAEDQNAKNKEKFGEWGETIGGWFDETKANIFEKLGEWSETFTTWFTEMPGKFTAWLVDWSDVIFTWFTEIPGKMLEWFAGWMEVIHGWYDSAKEAIAEKLDEWWTIIKGWFTDMPGSISEWFVGWYETISAWFTDTIQLIKDKLEVWWTTLKDWMTGVHKRKEVRDTGKNIVDEISGGTKDKQDDFTRKLGKILVEVAKAAFAIAAIAMLSMGREIVEKIIEGITNKAGALARSLGITVKNGVDSLISLWDSFRRMGANLISGFIAGMNSKAREVQNKAGEIAGKAARKIASSLQIFSPSRLTRGYGVYLGEGLIVGMDDIGRKVVSAAGRLADAAIPNVERMVSLDYATPEGDFRTLSSAVNGTVDVKQSSDEALIGAIQELRRDMTNLKVEMSEREVARIITPHVTDNQKRESDRDERWIRR